MKSLLLLLLVFSSHAFAQGGFVSSGGELFRDAKNPWFVRNTTEVKYCIKHDAATFSASLDEIRKAIQEGLKYWKDEFARNQSFLQPGFVEIGTQSFHEVNCSDSPEIEFLFGYPTLDKEGLEFLKDPRKFIGVTVRTKYDLAQLKAKGFVFFSSDLGEQSYDNNGALIKEAWRRPRILQYAVLHELGHIFGIPHMGTGLMSEVFLNQILDKTLVRNYEKYPIEPFLSPGKNLENCINASPSLTWFGGSTGNQCVLISMIAPRGPWKVYSKKNAEDTQPVELGEIISLNSDFMNMGLRGKPVLLLQLPEEQKVFTPKETLFRSFMVGPFMREEGLTGTYISKANQRPQPVYVNMTPSSVMIQATTMQNKLDTVFVFSSPISLLMLLSPNP